MWLLNLVKSINLSRIVLAFILAIFVWAYVSLTVYPEQSINFENIPVDLNRPESSDLIVRNNYQPQNVTVKVSGPRDKVGLVNAALIKAYVDLTKVNKPTSDLYDVKLKISDNVPDGLRYSVSPEKVELQIEDKRNIQFKIVQRQIGEVPTDSTLTSIKISPEAVTVSGPASLVAQVRQAVVDVNLSLNVSFTHTSRVYLLDANNNEIKQDEISVSPDTVNVDVQSSSNIRSRDVPIRVNTTGQPALGYVVGTTTREPAIVAIIGEPSAVSKVDYVETEAVDVSGAKSDITRDVLLKSPQGQNVIIGQAQKPVRVTISITPLIVSASVQQKVEEINLGPGLRYEFIPNQITITLSGSYQVFQTLQEKQFKLDQLKAQVDLAGRDQGEYLNVPVKISPPDGLSIVGQPTVTVRILREPTATPTLPPPTATPTPLVTQPPTATLPPATSQGVTPAPPVPTPGVTKSSASR